MVENSLVTIFSCQWNIFWCIPGMSMGSPSWFSPGKCGKRPSHEQTPCNCSLQIELCLCQNLVDGGEYLWLKNGIKVFFTLNKVLWQNSGSPPNALVLRWTQVARQVCSQSRRFFFISTEPYLIRTSLDVTHIFHKFKFPLISRFDFCIFENILIVQWSRLSATM